MPNMFFYNKNTGVGEFSALSATGALSRLHRFDTYRQGWDKIEQLQTGRDTTDKTVVGDLLFYDFGKGVGDVYRFDDKAAPEALSSRSDFSISWTHVVPVEFDGYTNVLFYDQQGFAEVWRYVDYGQFVHLKTIQNLPKGAFEIVTGVFGGHRGGLLLYDKNAGRGLVYRMNGETGELVLLRTHSSFATTWTTIVAIPFGFRTDLLFYSFGNGAAEVYRLDAAGGMERLNSYPLASWDQIVAVERPEDSSRPYVYFYRSTGVAQLYMIDGLGRLHFLSERTDLTKNWTHIGPVYEHPPHQELRLRVRAVVTAEPGGTTFSAGFSRATITAIVAATNEIYREAGIRLDFDPATDVEEVRSPLLNRDFELDANMRQTKYPTVDDPDTAAVEDVVPILPAKADGYPLYTEGRARMDLGARRRGRLVLIFRDHLQPLPGTTRDRSLPAGYASEAQEFIALPKTAWAPLAHELGHYLHLLHTFGGLDGLTLAKARGRIRDWVESQPAAAQAIQQGKPIPQDILNRGLKEALDADKSYTSFGSVALSILDTPADIGSQIYTDLGVTNQCATPAVDFTVHFTNGQIQTYTYSPDRRNLMSYLNDCGGGRRISPGQVMIMRRALLSGNRAHLAAA